MADHLVAALRAIDCGQCERTTRKEYECIREGYRSPIALYTDDKWCNSCICHYALNGGDVRTFKASRFVERAEEITLPADLMTEAANHG